MRCLGDFIRQVDVRNKDLAVTNLVGLSIDKIYIPSVANTVGTDLSNYKIIRENQFACSLMQVSRDKKMPIAVYKGNDAIMSPAYPIFEITNEEILLPDYLHLWFLRSEFDREVTFYAVGGVRGSLEWSDFCDLLIPVPPIAEQRAIVARHKAIEHKIDVNRRLIAALEETARTIYRHTFVDNIDPENLPQGWRMGTLEEVSDEISAGIIPSYDEASPFIVLGQKCNCHGYLDLSKCLHHIPKSNAKILQFNDVVINSTGSGTLGRVTQLWFSPKDLAYDSNMSMVRPKPQYATYIGELLLSKKEYFESISQGSTSQTRLYCSMLRPLEIIIPDLNLLKDFDNKVIPIRKYIHSLREEIQKLEKALLIL